MTVPIQIAWDLYQGKTAVWCECMTAGVRRAVLLPRLDPIFAPIEEDPARELPRTSCYHNHPAVATTDGSGLAKRPSPALDSTEGFRLSAGFPGSRSGGPWRAKGLRTGG